MTITQASIQCRADWPGSLEFPCSHPELKTAVTVRAYSKKEAQQTLDQAVADNLPALETIRRRYHTCPHCDGEGVIES